MNCAKPSDFDSLKEKKPNSYESSMKNLDSPEETNSSNKKKFGNTSLKDCAQILNEEMFKTKTRKEFTKDFEQPQLELRQQIEDLSIYELDKAHKKGTQSPATRCPAKTSRVGELRELIQKASLVSGLRKTVKIRKLFKSPPMSHLRRQIRGRLFVSISRIQQIKKNLKKSKILRTINKPDRKLKMRPIQKKLITREFLRKRKRDKMDLNNFAREVHCYCCNRLVHYSNNVFNQDQFWKTGNWEKIRLQDQFKSLERVCAKCEASQNKSRPNEADKMAPGECQKEMNACDYKNSFFKFQIEHMEASNQEKEETNSNSDGRGSLNLSEISLQNTQTQKNFQFKIEEASRIQKKNLSHVHEGQFICSSIRRTEYFAFYREEGTKLKFEDNLDQKLRSVREDDDYDTDEEIIEGHKKIILLNLERGIKRATRRRR